MLEIRPVQSYPGMFARSDGYIKMPDDLSTTRFIRGTIRRSKKGAKHSYYSIWNRRLGNLKVHQLVCEAFHGQRPSNKHGVSHRNEDALDNNKDNLVWATQKENLNMPNFLSYCKSRIGEDSPVVKGRK